MKYIRRFNNQTAYNQATIYKPSVSLIADSMSLVYDPMPFIPSTVEIGGIKWATCNVGATKPEEYGLYFQWGDIQGYTAAQIGSGEGKKYFGWTDYKYGNGTSNPGPTGMTKYNSTDGLITLELTDDSVHAAYGGNWRMPTSTEFQTLGTLVTTAWTANYQGSGVAGLVCTAIADNTKVLFFPAAGYFGNGIINNVGSIADYWSSSLYTSSKVSAYSLSSYGSHVNWAEDYYRYGGRCVRGVLAE